MRSARIGQSHYQTTTMLSGRHPPEETQSPQKKHPIAVQHHTMTEGPPTNADYTYLIDIINNFYHVFRLHNEHVCNRIEGCFSPVHPLRTFPTAGETAESMFS